MEMCLLGGMVGAQEARECGLVNWVAEPGRLEERAADVAGRLAAGPPVALGLMKDALLANAGGGKEAAVLLEVLSASVNHYTRDKREGLAAFLDKRPPLFRGE